MGNSRSGRNVDLDSERKGMKTNPDDPVNGFRHGRYESLTKREYFAAMAMQGFAANSGMNYCDAQDTSKEAVKQADALIAALNGERKP